MTFSDCSSVRTESCARKVVSLRQSQHVAENQTNQQSARPSTALRSGARIGVVPKLSGGLLLWRRSPDLQVLLAHPGGPFYARKDEGVWSLPKGEPEPGEDLLTAAR